MTLRRRTIPMMACMAGVLSLARMAGAAPNGQDSSAVPGGIYRGVSTAASFDVSPPLRSIPPLPVKPEEHTDLEDRPSGLEGAPGPQSIDPLVQSWVGPGEIPAPAVSFDGPNNIASVSPPDPVGDVGPSHYVAMSNLYFAIYSKTGTLLYGPAANNTLWTGFGGDCETDNSGDPIVVYDQFADRWILTQFTASGPTYFNCVAISTTGDPTGTYYRYAFSTGTNFPDYPKYGVWTDAYHISTREFAGASFAGIGAYALNRAQMIAGNPAPQVISFLVPPGATPYNTGDGLLPADVDGSTLPPAGSPEYYMGSMDNGGPYGAPQDALTLWKFHVDFAVPANSTFLMASPIPVAAFDSMFPCSPGSRDCIPQPGTSNKLDVLSYRQRLMHRLAYRNFGSHESLVANQSVEASANIAGIRWYEVRDPNGSPTVFQQGTYAPGTSDGIHRWMGSVAMNVAGDIALGYSASDATTTFPSVWYTGRLSSDPAGTLPQGEGSFVNGTGSQTGSQRWGDYTSLNVDPVDDCTFWYVNEYVPVTSSVGWRLRIGSFKFPSCVAGPSGTLQGQITVCAGGLPIAGASVTAGLYGTTTDAGGNYSFALPPGDHTVAVSAPGYTAGGGPVTIVDGETTIFDACLTGIPVILADGASLVAESCEPANGVIDPGETVTVSLCLQNTGGADTTDLVGTLQATGGVSDPSDPQSYGAVTAGAGTVCRDFTFTADTSVICGDVITASLDLSDGASSLGTLVYVFQTGTLLGVFSEDFDGVAAPTLPAGWTAANAQGAPPLWLTSEAAPDTAPNDAFVDDPSVITDKRLDSPSIPIMTASAQLSFRNFYVLESTYDGGVLEISIGGGAFTDILAAGGSFVSNGYNGTISGSFGSPIAGRQAWSGNSGGYLTTVVNLPAAAAGQSVVLRWRMASDNSVSATGWRIDTIVVTDGYTCCTPIPAALTVDASAPGVPTVGQNKVWEPGETVVVEPSYYNGDSSALVLTGMASNLTGPAGAAYMIGVNAADYGQIPTGGTSSCNGTGLCYEMSVDNPAVRPAQHWDATFDEVLSNGAAKTWTLHIGDSFTDVPDANLFYAFIETIFHNGVTGGCGGTDYCPGNPALRKQMAVFLLKARYGSGYVPPPCAGVFADVPCPSLFADWIEDLYNRGITGGCSVMPLNYCPDNTVLRQQMAVFLLKALLGAGYVPPPCVGVFADVPCPSLFADWIEDLAARGITSGCGAGNFCPGSPNTRGQMAVFLTKTFGLLLYGP